MTVKKLRPVRKESLMQRAYTELREALLCGRFEPGELITVRELAEEMQLGVMPVRECIRQLTAEGAIEFMPNRSVRVPYLTINEFEEVYDIRMLVESYAASKAANIVTRQQLQKISRYLGLIANLQDGQDAHECLLANMRFHFEIYKASGYPHLVGIIERLWLRVSSLLIITYSAPQEQRAKFFSKLDDHESLVKALADHDAEKAGALTRDILRRSRDWHLAYNTSLKEKA